MRQPLGSSWRVKDEFNTVTSSPMPTMVARRVLRVRLQGLPAQRRRSDGFLSTILSSSSSVPSSEAPVTRRGVGWDWATDSFSRYPLREPFRECAGFQFILLLWRRILANECRVFALCVLSLLSGFCPAGCPTARDSVGFGFSPSEVTEDVSTEAPVLSSDDPDERLFIGRRGGSVYPLLGSIGMEICPFYVCMVCAVVATIGDAHLLRLGSWQTAGLCAVHKEALNFQNQTCENTAPSYRLAQPQEALIGDGSGRDRRRSVRRERARTKPRLVVMGVVKTQWKRMWLLMPTPAPK